MKDKTKETKWRKELRGMPLFKYVIDHPDNKVMIRHRGKIEKFIESLLKEKQKLHDEEVDKLMYIVKKGYGKSADRIEKRYKKSVQELRKEVDELAKKRKDFKSKYLNEETD